MLSVGVLALECSNLHFLDVGVSGTVLWNSPCAKTSAWLYHFILGTCSLCTEDGRSAQVRHQTSSHHHCGLQTVQTSTQSVTRYEAALGLQPENLKHGRFVTNGNTWISTYQQYSQTVVLISSLLCGCEEQTILSNLTVSLLGVSQL